MYKSFFVILSLVTYAVVSPANAADTNPQPDSMNMQMSSASSDNNAPDKMSDMIKKMESMKIEKMGHDMMMWGMQMKMQGEAMSHSAIQNTKDQGNQLMNLGKQVFDLGNKMNPKPVDMNKEMMNCPMCEKMKKKD
ncbi:MAG TPA: hypothetical protein VL360_01935 [Gammaproteobacteria bacterium]|jgi:hypothetical protein|nr:hypothetical protein [Gammaproteobacteria bacterium]